MNLLDVLALANSCGVALRVEGERLWASPRERVTPELGAALAANKAALMLVLRGASWPWMSDPAFDGANARCNCGAAPHLFTQYGQPICKRCACWTDDMDNIDSVAR